MMPELLVGQVLFLVFKIITLHQAIQPSQDILLSHAEPQICNNFRPSCECSAAFWNSFFGCKFEKEAHEVLQQRD